MFRIMRDVSSLRLMKITLYIKNCKISEGIYENKVQFVYIIDQTSDEIKGKIATVERITQFEVSDYTELGYENDINFNIVISPDLTIRERNEMRTELERFKKQ
jgi:hypothetical protein